MLDLWFGAILDNPSNAAQPSRRDWQSTVVNQVQIFRATGLPCASTIIIIPEILGYDEPCEQCTHVSAWLASANLEHPVTRVTRGFKSGPLLASPAWLAAARHDQLASTEYMRRVNTRPLSHVS
jgi:hypothetical protein